LGCKASAKRNKRFLLLFWKKKTLLLGCFSWGQAPKPPWFRFAEGLGCKASAMRNKRFLLLFLEKEDDYQPQRWASSKYLGSASPRFVSRLVDAAPPPASADDKNNNVDNEQQEDNSTMALDALTRFRQILRHGRLILMIPGLTESLKWIC
jgi:hypothetical protein